MTDLRGFQHGFLGKLSDFTQILAAMELVPGALFMIKNLDSRYIYMSRALREAVNLHHGQEVVGRTDFDLFPKIIAQSFRQNDLLVFKHGKPLVNEVHVTGFFAHSPKWLFSSKYPLHGPDGRVVGLITINHPYDAMMGREAELNRLLPAVEHVFKNYPQDISIAHLARLCGFSQSHFMRVFKERMNMTAHAFVEQVRMFHAIDAIKHSATSMAQIATDCGFYDPSSFVKRFRIFTGTTPLRYRREHQTRVQPEQTKVLPEPARWT